MDNPYSHKAGRSTNSVMSRFDSVTRFESIASCVGRSKEKTSVILPQSGVRYPSFAVVGVLERGQETPFAIDGVDFWMGDDTWVVGTPGIGHVASVAGPILEDGRHLAKRLIVRNK